MQLPMALALALALAGPAPQRPAPTAEQVRAAIEALEAAFRSPEPAERIGAIREHARIDAAGVLAIIARGLDDRDVEVRLEAIEALGQSRSSAALDHLLEHRKSRRQELRKQERVLPRLLVAIARHGDARAIPALTDDAQAQLLQVTLRARILGLANIRSKKSVEALFELMAVLGFVEMHAHAEDFRLALLVLTGVDRGRSLDAWKTWWAKEREQVEVPAAMPKLAQADAERWAGYWSQPRDRGDARGL